jgi:tRNA (Thr-GGU) A37 N-methylase
LLKIQDIDKIDVLDSSPVIDIKPYNPKIDTVSDVVIPGWVKE